MTHTFEEEMPSQATMLVLSVLQQLTEELRATELRRARRQLKNLSPEQWQIIEELSQNIVNKLFHMPMLRTRQAAAEGDGQCYAAMLCELFDLKIYPPDRE